MSAGVLRMLYMASFMPAVSQLHTELLQHNGNKWGRGTEQEAWRSDLSLWVCCVAARLIFLQQKVKVIYLPQKVD